MISYSLEFEHQRSHPSDVPVASVVASSMLQCNPSRPADDHLHHGRNKHQSLGKSPPVFNIVVNDDIWDSDQLHNEDDSNRQSVRGRKEPFPATNYNNHNSYYEPIFNRERDQLYRKNKYDCYGETVFMV